MPKTTPGGRTPSIRETSSANFAFRAMSGVVVPGLKLFAKIRVSGAENLPETGAAILVANHFTELDPLVIGAVVYAEGRLPRFLAKESLFTAPVVGKLLADSGQVPVRRTGAGRFGPPLEAAEQIVEGGHLVIIYPEGSLTRDPDLWPMRGKTGAARMAIDLDLPVIPVAHWGDQKIMPRWGKKISLFPRKTVAVRFGPPVDLDAYRGRRLDSASLTAATNDILDAITAILEDLRGETAPAERWDPVKHKQTEIGRFDDV